MSDKVEMFRTDWRGNRITREVNLVADARNVVGLAGYPWLIIAANPHLSNREIEMYLRTCGIPGVQRPSSWIQRRRFLFRQSSTLSWTDRDGNQARAVEIMRENPTASSRQLVHLLKKHDIIRSREWIRRHRCDPY
jgi:hypothetical protein